ncbi:exodeoxyribonuclease III [soil metagenome]
MFTIATWNVNSLKVRLEHVLLWLAEMQPDVLALQETKLQDAVFPYAALNEAGYSVIFSGQKTYNGMALLSKQKAENIVTDIPDYLDAQRRILAATINNIRIINLYVPNGESVDSAKYQYKLSWLVKVQAYIQQQLQLFPRVVVLGDFNIAPADADVYDPVLWQDKVLCSTSEREALQQLLAIGLIDSFRLFPQPEKSYSWWDYRMAAFRRDLGLRIDHILISQALAAVCKNCTIDKRPRSWERPSDHTPVMVSLDLASSL